MKTYTSNEELFQAVNAVINRLQDSGYAEAASEVESSFAYLNGLTDGWALAMESIERVLNRYGHILPIDQASELKDMLNAVKKVVYR